VGFPEDIFLKNTRTEVVFTANDFFFDFGAQYRMKIKNKYSLTTGAIYSNQSDISSKLKYLVTSYYGDINSVQPFYDTIAESDITDGSFVMPTKVGVGASFEEDGRWLAGVDFSWQNWEKFELFGVPDSLRNSWTIAVGGEITPDRNTLGSYWNTVTYRAGFNYKKSYLTFQDTDINEIGISFGFGFPLPRTRTSLNLAMEIGKVGTVNNGLIQENYIRFTFGVNIFENWFIKSKYF
jgi:long-subunit fatty acid transport protein